MYIYMYEGTMMKIRGHEFEKDIGRVCGQVWSEESTGVSDLIIL